MSTEDTSSIEENAVLDDLKHLCVVGRKEEAKKYLSYFSDIGNSREVIQFEVGDSWKKENLISHLVFNLGRDALAAVKQDDPESKYGKYVIWNSPKDNRDEVAEELTESRYDFVRGTAEFEKILEILAE